MSKKFWVDGSSSERIGRFLTWRVVGNDGEILCKFHGPMSRAAALAFCKALNEDSVPGLCDSTFDNHRHDYPVNVKEWIA